MRVKMKAAVLTAEQYLDEGQPPEGVCTVLGHAPYGYAHLHTEAGVVIVQNGNFILTDNTGRQSAVPERFFQETYEEVATCE